MGKKQKTEERERKKERLNDGNNNGQATHSARKHAWRTQAAWANKNISDVTQQHCSSSTEVFKGTLPWRPNF